MPGRAGAAVGGGGAQHTPLRCPGLCRTSPRGESSLSGQPPVLVASACLGLSGLCPLSSVSALCFPRPPPGSESLISLLSPHRRVRPCPAPAAWCPCFSSQRGAPGAGRPRLLSAGGREETWARRAPGARWAVCGPGRLQAARHRSVLLYSGSGPPSPAAQAALLPPPRCCSPNGQGHAGPRQTATTVEWRSPGRGVGLAACRARPFRSESRRTVGRGS